MVRLILVSFALVIGCAAPPIRELGAAHPASPEAAEAPAPPLTDTLAVDEEVETPRAAEPSHHGH